MAIRFSPARRRRTAIKTKELAIFLRGVVNEYLTDNCPHLAASISYYVLLSLFPLTLAAMLIVGKVTHDTETESKVIDAVGDFLPVSGDYIENTIRGVSANWGATGTVAIIGLLWGGMAVFSAVRKSLNAAWGIRTPRPFFVERFMELCMMLGVGLLLLISFSLTAAVGVVENLSDTAVGGLFGGAVFWTAVRILLTTGLAFVTFLMLYKFIPNTRVRWGDVWGGALLAAVAFEVAQQVFIWYAGDLEHNPVYGTVGRLIALLAWVYVSAAILLFCAKLTSVYSRHRIIAPKTRSVRGRRRFTNKIEIGPPVPRYDTTQFTRAGTGTHQETGEDANPPEETK